MSLIPKMEQEMKNVPKGFEDTVDFNETTSPSQLHEVTLDPLSSSNDGNTGPTMKDYEAQLSHYKKENFNLKLRIYFLEERLGPYRGSSEKEDPHQKNIELKVETETLRKELSENQQLLRDAARAMDQLEKQHKEAMQKVIEEQKTEKEKLEMQIEGMKKDYEAQLQQPNHENSAAMYALAFGMPELLKPNSSFDKDMEEKLKQKIKELENQVIELESHLNNVKEECSHLESELSNVRTEKEELDQDVERCGNQITEMKGKLDEKDQELESARKQITNLEEALMAKEPEIRIKVQELSERDKMIEEANSKLEAKEKVLVEIQITLDEKQRQIEALRASLASKDEALAGLRSKLAESESATRDLQDKMKNHWMDGLALSPKQMVQLDKNVVKKRFVSYRNHTRGQKEVPNGGGSTLPKRPGTAPPIGKGVESDEEAVQKLLEEVEMWKKKAEEMKNEVQQKDNLVKNWGNEGAKMKGTLQGITKHAKELERELEKSKQDLRRKDKKIRDLLCELTVAHDQVNRAKWEGVGGGGVGRQHGMGVGFSSGLDDVTDMADEENERLWAELEDKKKKLNQVTEEKNALSTEMEKKLQALMSALKEKETSLAGFEEKYNSAAVQLAEKSERIQALEAQLLTSGSLNSLEQRTTSKTTSVTEWISQQNKQNTSTLKEMFTHRLSSAAEDHSFLHSHLQKLQRNLRNTPERDGGPRGAREEAEEARREAEEIRALLGGHLWELAAFLEGILEESNLSLSEPRKSALRRALEWSRELSLSVLSTTGLGEDSERDCTRTSLAMLRDFPSFCACVESAGCPLLGRKEEQSVHIGEMDGHVAQTIVISEVESPKPEDDSLEVQGACPSMESLHSTVEALRTRVRELEKEVGGKTIDLREGSSEIGRGGNSGESVRTVRDVRPSHISLSHSNETLKIVGQKLEGRSDVAPLSCTPAGAIASPSESEGWSEPDRTVSLARMGLEDVARSTPSVPIVSAAQQSTPESGGSSLVETRTPSKRTHGEVRRLQNRLRGLEQVIEALRAELRVYHSMTPAAQTSVVEGQPISPPHNNVLQEVTSRDQESPSMRDAEVNTTVGVQSEETVDAGGLGHLLDEVRCQRDKLEYSLKHNELIGRQLEGVLSGLKCYQLEDGMANLCHKLKEATERLEEEQARCCDLRNQLTAAKSTLNDLERELKESKAVEMKLRATLRDKNALLKDVLGNEKSKDKDAVNDYRSITEELHDGAYARDMDKKELCAEGETKDDTKLNDSIKEKISPEHSFSFGDEVFFRKGSTLPESKICNNKARLQNWCGQDKVRASEDWSLGQKLHRSMKELDMLEKHNEHDESSPKAKRSAHNQEVKNDRLLEVEKEALHLRLALKEAQDHVQVEELRARKAEEEANHWMKLAKEFEKVRKIQETAGIKAVEDPSECSSSSALSGILPNLARQRSEMSDYVSDQTGGEDSEPSISQMPHQTRNLCGRPGIIPLEVSHAMAYLSPSADTSPTARHDAFSSPDLGIESDAGRFSSLENPPPKSPEGMTLDNMSFADVHSTENTIVYSRSFTEVDRSHRTRASTSHIIKDIDDVVSVSFVRDLRLENERLRQCLAETQKNLDETLSKLEAANRRKLNVEKAICNQLQKTHHILRKARVNLEAEKKE